ncbi:class I SAM-dependent methyltransferase [Candidatus Nitrosotenuis sp. DW1]|uniref:class I SAM-dependent methyltransferase n=1 Tax=Candidatus Nitrosotenuis sp. DW1 TaxID=2259672 RepID=UPI0015CEDFF3|nr:class I SAM-dependent methyltransferase [Candidatus Nitrosotenuis sp. DW1]QLH08962.1 methylase [Candidatus Nitrosotenuis sp. DW1]
MKAGSPKDLIPEFFDNTAQTYDSVVNWATFGKDRHWKKEILKQIPNCETILDLACGTGILTFQIAELFPNSQIIGVDITESYLNVAKKKNPHQRVSFLKQDAEKLDIAQKFDCIVSSYIPKYCDPENLIPVCLNHLKPNGKIILHDFTYPKSSIVKSLWNAYFVVLNVIGYFVPSWKKVFADLPKLIRTTKWLDDYEQVMKKHGLETHLQSLTWNSSAVLTGIKKI